MSAPIFNLFADALSEADAGAAIGRGIRFMQKARAMGIAAPHFYIGKSPFYLKNDLRKWALAQKRPLYEKVAASRRPTTPKADPMTGRAKSGAAKS
jgi:hypothetical protein